MYVHHGAGLIYLANPRTASRSTAKALMGIGFKMVGSHHSGLEGEFLAGGRWVPFTTVRDISTMLPSWARHANTTVEDFVTRCLPGNRAIIAGWEPWTLFPHEKRAQLLLRFENIEAELNRLLEAYGLGPVTLERIGNP